MMRHAGSILTGVSATLLLMAAPGRGQDRGQVDHTHTPPGATVPLFDNLGNLHHEISTAVPLTQQYFDQGLRLTYGFNHAEAIAAYRQAAELDSTCAMCYWGIAWAAGPNINASMDSASGMVAYQAAQKAVELIDHATAQHRAFIRAMAQRYGADPGADRSHLDSMYARATGEVADRYPDDPEAQVLAAEALMLLSPWDYWTADKQPRPGTETLLRRLTAVMDRDPNHPGACHFFIHAVESAYPERAIDCAERLPALMPGAGHVVHMPAHVYIRVGRYADAIVANEHAVHADEQYIADRRPTGLYPLGYYPHNYHFLSFAAEMAGQSRTALDAARSLAARVDMAAIRSPDFRTLEHYFVAPYRVMVRFGDWDRVLQEPSPAADLPYAMGVWHWARGIALVRKDDLAAARRELAALRTRAADPATRELLIWNINPASALLEIATHHLAGELGAAGRDWDTAIAELQLAVQLEDALTYDEPPTWELPMRHVLGAVLLEAGRPAEAETVYRRALDRFPQNGWSLFGLAQALEAQGREQEAGRVRARFRVAWRTADVTLTASRF